MKKTLITGIAALLLATGTAHSWDRRQTTFGKGYLSGILAGLSIANAALWSKGQQELFCPPEKLDITGEMLEDMMRKYGEEHPELRSSQSISTPIGALLTLQGTFPCKPQ